MALSSPNHVLGSILETRTILTSDGEKLDDPARISSRVSIAPS